MEEVKTLKNNKIIFFMWFPPLRRPLNRPPSMVYNKYNFIQGTAYKASVCWSKYTTLKDI